MWRADGKMKVNEHTKFKIIEKVIRYLYRFYQVALSVTHGNT